MITIYRNRIVISIWHGKFNLRVVDYHEGKFILLTDFKIILKRV